MTQNTKLGFVTLPAEYVFERAITKQIEIEESREKKRLEFIENIKKPAKRLFFFTRRPLTDEEALKYITDDMWLWNEYFYYTPKWKSDRDRQIEKLIDVSCRMIQLSSQYENTDMQLTIEAANMII